MKKYKYTGESETALAGYGIVKPQEVITVDFKVNHPLFVEITENDKSKKIASRSA